MPTSRASRRPRSSRSGSRSVKRIGERIALVETARGPRVHTGQAIVLSAGAIASSRILQRSGLGGGRAGRGLAFNLASPVTLEFDRDLHSERGAQISHYYKPSDVVLETWFNPIVTQSLFMPGWFGATGRTCTATRA